FIADGPVVAQPVDAPAAEVVWAETEGDTAPVVGAPAQHARTEPVEGRAGSHGVGLTFERPAAQPRIELAELSFGNGRPASRAVVGPREHLRIARRVPHDAGLEHDDIRAGFGENLGGHPAPGARAHDAHVELAPTANHLHGCTLPAVPRHVNRL